MHYNLVALHLTKFHESVKRYFLKLIYGPRIKVSIWLQCAPGGCLLELSIQLAIIMIGKQFINTIVEMMMPYLLKWWNIIRTIGRKKR